MKLGARPTAAVRDFIRVQRSSSSIKQSLNLNKDEEETKCPNRGKCKDAKSTSLMRLQNLYKSRRLYSALIRQKLLTFRQKKGHRK